MPRIDGYPAADPLTGDELLLGMQGGKTKSISPEQLAQRIIQRLGPDIAQMVAAAYGSVPPPSADITNALSDSAGILLADDAGLPLLAG